MKSLSRLVAEINQRLIANLRQEDFKGWDVFDGLNASLLHKTGLYRFPLIRLIWIQFFKRFPINLRALVGVPKKRNPKGIALVILGLIEDYQRTNDKKFLEEASQLGDWLLAHTCDDLSADHCSWGYHFPWEARAFHVPLGKANIITTSYVAQALWRLTDYGAGPQYSEAACKAGVFIKDKLFIDNGTQCYFAYIPGEEAFVHNASLWGAAIVAETSRRLNNPVLTDIAQRVCRESIKAQNSDGSWAYGTRSHHGFIDGFHTGYNLEALDMARKALLTDEFDAPIEKGLNYYRQNFFLNDGTPKYYNNNIYPIDMHSVSQAILTFIKVGKTQQDYQLLDKVVSWSIDNMYINKTGNFRYQKTRWYRNNINYMRWTQAWSYYSFAFYHHHLEEVS